MRKIFSAVIVAVLMAQGSVATLTVSDLLTMIEGQQATIEGMQRQISFLQTEVNTLKNNRGLTATETDALIESRAIEMRKASHRTMLVAILLNAKVARKDADVIVDKYFQLISNRKTTQEGHAYFLGEVEKAVSKSAIDVNALTQQIVATETFRVAVTGIAEGVFNKKILEVKNDLKTLRGQITTRNTRVDANFQAVFAKFAEIPAAFKEAKTVDELKQSLKDLEALTNQVKELDKVVKLQSTTHEGVDMQKWTKGVDGTLKTLIDFQIYGKQMLQGQQEGLNTLSTVLSENDPENGRGKKQIKEGAERAKAAVKFAADAKAEWDEASKDAEPEAETEEKTESEDESATSD